MQTNISQINDKNETGEFQEAISLALEALKEMPQDYALWIGLANAYYGIENFPQAQNAYLKASELEPTDVISLSNLAGMYFEQKRFKEGINICAKGIERKSDYTNLYIHQGNCFSSLSEHQKALASYQKARDLNPQDETILFNLAYAYMMTQQSEKAEETYELLLKNSPDNPEYIFAFASFLEQSENLVKACETYLDLLKVEPTTTTHLTISGCLYGLLLKEDSEAVFSLSDKWLEAYPNNPIALHFLDTLKNSTEVKRASADYVGELFDAFAESFDDVLAKLDYKAPLLIAQKIETLSFDMPPKVLDLGAGTGLCSLALKEKNIQTASLTGVDLSEKMLEKARLRGLYTNLEQKDILSYLPEHQEEFDLIYSADVFTYLGDLTDLFKGIYGALKQKGRTVFTVSENKDTPTSYALEPSGRFMHGKEYLKNALTESGLHLLQIEDVALRQELEKPVAGLLVVCQKD